MTTIPPERDPSPVQDMHRLRQVAEGFGADAARYDRARPSYPDALVQRIVAASPGAEFLDVGCGTGIEARQFQAAGCTVLGVEPDSRMAGFARACGVDVEVATFEEWDAAGREYDAVIAGTAWHWVDPVAGAAKAARVLRPGGRLALFWHVFQPPAVVSDASAEAYRLVMPDSPFNPRSRPPGSALDAYQPILTRAADGVRTAGGFGESEQWSYAAERVCTRDEYLDFMPTAGNLAQLQPDKLAHVLDSTAAAIDALGGTLTMTIYTAAVTALRLPLVG